MEEQIIKYKIVLLGNIDCGKASIYRKITTGQFSEKNISTNEMGIVTISIEVDIEENGKIQEKKFELTLIDTSGEEKFRSIIKDYLKLADCILLIYNINIRESFNNLKKWLYYIKEWRETYDNNLKYITCLIGNDFN